ncbi:MAG: S8 family serine peptidase [Blautia sp.]|nr:S8 family serine peptidase [Blautia sp.]MCM1213439.1 S8 family serine peptidase [Lachnospiraceae bacterium]
MKGKRVKKVSRAFLSLLLSAVLFAEPAVSAAVTYAAEPVSGQTADMVEGISGEDGLGTPSGTEEGKEENISGETGNGEDGTDEGGSGETGSGEDGTGEGGSSEIGSGEDGTGEGGSGETGSGEDGTGEGGSGETGSGGDGAGEGDSGETGSGEDGSGETGDGQDENGEDGSEEDPEEGDLDEEDEEGLEDEELEDADKEKEEEEDPDNWQGTGHKAPELEMQLTSAMVSEKIELRGTSERLQKLEKGREYAPNEAVYLASSKKYAETVAEGYGASLESYEDGVAVMVFSDEVTDIIAMAEDEKVKLPAVYPNFYYTTCSDVAVYSDATPAGDVNTATSNDKYYTYQYHHDEIHSPAAWEYNNAAGSGIKVAVIDSGIEKTHEDLKKRVASASSTSSYAYNKAEDNDGHGTHVSGIIAANKDNGIGGAGIAYNATIVSIKALEESPLMGGAGGDTADIIKAVNSAVKSGVKVINMSLGGKGYDALYEATIDVAVNKGVVVVAAAGNDSILLSTDINSVNYRSPACFKNVITVSAKTKGESTLAYFSNYGEGIVDITAPGTGIFSTFPKALTHIELIPYVGMDGTSQATPMVAAAAAYIFSVSPDLKNNKTKAAVDTVKKILQDSATKTGYTDSAKFGAGLLNVEAAVRMAAPTAADKGGTGELTAPTVQIGGTDVANNATIQRTDMIALSATVDGTTNSEIKIYYTLDGKAPTEKSTLYTAPFSIEASGNKTIKAIAVYYGKKSKVTTIKVKVNANMSSFKIVSKTNSTCLGAGKNMTLTVDTKSITPAYATNKKVTWEISQYDGGATKDNVSINSSSGQLKATAALTAKGTVTVKATAKDGGGATATLQITLLPKVTKLELKAPVFEGKTYLMAFDPIPEQDGKPAQLNQVQMEVTVTPEDANTGISYTSSNVKVAAVTESGLIKAVGNGKATITAKTTDGSNKKVTLQVQVTKKVQSIMVKSKTGESQLAAGKTLQMVAEVTSDATNKKVTWSIVEGEGAAATINASGKLTAKSNNEVTAVSTVTVKAEAADGSGKSDTMTITVYPSITGKILFEEGTSRNLGTTEMGELRKTIQLHPYTENHTSTYFGRAKDSGELGLDNFIYTSSNKKIATVSGTGLVEVNKEGKTGSAKIKVTARDGSGKSASYTIKVVKPVTSLSIYSKTGRNVVGNGKTLALGASVGGNPSNKKVKWASSNTNIATVDKNGKVKGVKYDPTTKKSTVTITATAEDGSGVSNTFEVCVQPAITKLAYKYNILNMFGKPIGTTCKTSRTLGLTYSRTIDIVTDDEGNVGSEINYHNYDYLNKYLPWYFDTSCANGASRLDEDGYDYWDWASITCTCSNSNVIQIETAKINGNLYDMIVPVNKGKATITFKALDGSGKSAKLNITVK